MVGQVFVQNAVCPIIGWNNFGVKIQNQWITVHPKIKLKIYSHSIAVRAHRAHKLFEFGIRFLRVSQQINYDVTKKA